jgi:vacuolar-type H+-ATPase subunit H
VEDKVVEEIQLHQETVGTDQNSPLHLIREKEIEISGQVLRAKREADEIVANARRKAAELISAAENEGSEGGEGRRNAIEADAASEAERVLRDSAAEVSELEGRIAGQREQAVEMVLKAVARV